MPLAQEAEMRLKIHEGLNDNNPSVMYINTVPQKDSVVMANQNQSRQ